MAINVVEMIAAAESADCAFDQRCKFGHRVEGHAVYCHNDQWADSPRKCRRSWYSDGEIKDEDCPGFQPNPEFKGELLPTPLVGERCSRCGGTRLIKADRETVETCPRCMGDGAEPHAVPMSTFEQDTLEMGLTFSGRHPCQFEYYARIAETKSHFDGVMRLSEMDLIDLRSVSYAGDFRVCLIRLTAKGDAVVRMNWEARKAKQEKSPPSP